MCMNMRCNKFVWAKKHDDDEYYALKAEMEDKK